MQHMRFILSRGMQHFEMARVSVFLQSHILRTELIHPLKRTRPIKPEATASSSLPQRPPESLPIDLKCRGASAAAMKGFVPTSGC